MTRQATHALRRWTARVLTTACCGLVLTATAGPVAAQQIEITPDLEVEQIAEGVWIHTTWKPYQGTRIQSNGMIVVDDGEIVLIDTAWGVEETRALLAWMDEAIGLPIRTAVATHFHDDRLEGGGVLAERGVRMVAHPMTVSLATAFATKPEPLAALETGRSYSLGGVELYYPGPGHTSDNIVAWVRGSGLLFGGCLIRPGDATGLGNTNDADVSQWPRSVLRLLDRYSDARTVIPSHGPAGDRGLLDHTLSLLR